VYFPEITVPAAEKYAVLPCCPLSIVHPSLCPFRSARRLTSETAHPAMMYPPALMPQFPLDISVLVLPLCMNCCYNVYSIVCPSAAEAVSEKKSTLS